MIAGIYLSYTMGGGFNDTHVKWYILNFFSYTLLNIPWLHNVYTFLAMYYIIITANFAVVSEIMLHIMT